MDFYRGIAIGLGEEPKFRKVDLFNQVQAAILKFYNEKKIHFKVKNIIQIKGAYF